MGVYISLLRGINVGGSKQVKMDVLRALYEGLGFRHTETYIQSGNVVFVAEEAPNDVLERKISDCIKEQLGFDVPVVVKTLEELRATVDGSPFANDASKEEAHLYLTFLLEKPSDERFQQLALGDYLGDELVLIGRMIYLYCPKGYGRTKLTNTFFESKLGLKATTRNWRTTKELLAIASRYSLGIS